MSSISQSSLWLQGRDLGYTLPDGRVLFHELELALHTSPAALVGRNGVGKSVLARLLAGTLQPTRGQVDRLGVIAHVEQRTHGGIGSVADRLGVAAELAALARISAGSSDTTDFELIDSDWDMPVRLSRWLNRLGLDYLKPTDDAGRLSGGELARLGLIAALWRDPDHLILDEPSNHLDRKARRYLSDFVMQWQGGILLISHDRALLEQVSEIYRLDGLGLHRYSGNYSAYVAAHEREQQTLTTQITQGKAALRREQRAKREIEERQQRRLARGRRDRSEANQSKLLLNRQRERSEHGTSRLAAGQSARVARHAASLRALQQRREVVGELSLEVSPAAAHKRVALEVQSLSFGYDQPMIRDLDFMLMAGERCALLGANGSGKSTLMQLLVGRLTPQSGAVRLHVPYAFIDQHTSLLDESQSPLENFHRLAPGLAENEYHHRLAQLRLGSEFAERPVAHLSGGERLKTALACALLGAEPKPLLLLDEPTNSLDLDAISTVEAALRHYKGTLLVVSHDQHFLDAIGITREVTLDTRY